MQKTRSIEDNRPPGMRVHHGRPGRRRLGQILVPGALALVGSALAFCWAVDVRPDPEVQRLLQTPSAAEVLRQGRAKAPTQADTREPLLVTHAKVFARQVNPQPPVQSQPESGPRQSQPVTPAVTFAPKFKVQGTSYCPSQPSQSMVLISEPTGELRWIKQGTSVDHGTIEQVKSGSVVYRSGSQTWEMKVEDTQL
jgi:hypothetical protein